MFKYVKYTKVKKGTVIQQFYEKNDEVKVNHFDEDVVSISADDEALLDALIASQDDEINCIEIEKDEFKTLVANSSRVKRINNVVASKFKKRLEVISSKYSQQERETWGIQKSEALAYKESSDEDDAPFLKILADGAGVTIDVFAGMVIANNNNFITLSANALRDKQILQAELLSEIGV